MTPTMRPIGMECILSDLIPHAIVWLHRLDLQVAGGVILFIDMILCALLLAIWDKTGKARGSAGNRRL